MESKVRPNGFDCLGYDRNVCSSEINRKEAVFGTDKVGETVQEELIRTDQTGPTVDITKRIM